LDTSTSRPSSPPRGPITRARAKAIHQEVNSLLTTLDLGTPLDGMLPHADMLCVIIYEEHQDPGEEDTPRSRGGEDQRDVKMDMELDPESSEEREEGKMAGRPRTRSNRPPDWATRSGPGSRLVPTGHSPGAPEPRPVPDPVRTGCSGPRPGRTGPLTGSGGLTRPDRSGSAHLIHVRPKLFCTSI
jgi:hypothetical protein